MVFGCIGVIARSVASRAGPHRTAQQSLKQTTFAGSRAVSMLLLGRSPPATTRPSARGAAHQLHGLCSRGMPTGCQRGSSKTRCLRRLLRTSSSTPRRAGTTCPWRSFGRRSSRASRSSSRSCIHSEAQPLAQHATPRGVPPCPPARLWSSSVQRARRPTSRVALARTLGRAGKARCWARWPGSPSYRPDRATRPI